MGKNAMPVNATHPEYNANLAAWTRARRVMAGEDAVKAAGEIFLPRLDLQNDEEYAAYKARASFFNATSRTADGFVGLIFRRAPFVRLPDFKTGVGLALKRFQNDVDLSGTTLASYAQNMVRELVEVGRAGTLIDWEGASRTHQCENRAYATFYAAEDILNWRVERINGRNLTTLVVLAESWVEPACIGDSFDLVPRQQIRVLRLVPVASGEANSEVHYEYEVELWQRFESGAKRGKAEWRRIQTQVPLRLGKPLPLIPFVFHGSRHGQADVDVLPLRDIIYLNLDHYRLDADYKHGVHFTALPTAWVAGFDKKEELTIGSRAAWCTESIGATAGFLEFTGQGLTTFERAMDRDERLMAALGARLIESQKRVGESAEAIALRQTGEDSILGNLSRNAGVFLTQILSWVYWWNSTEAFPDDVTSEQVLVELNTDFSAVGLGSQELMAAVHAWQAGALSRESLMDLFRRGEVLPAVRTNAEETKLINAEPPAVRAGSPAGAARGGNGQATP